MIIDLESYSPAQLRELSIELERILPHKMESSSSNQMSIEKQRGLECPFCHSNHVVKNGHTKKGVQKYFCKTCKKYFYPTTNSVLCRARNSYMKFEEFIVMESHKATLKEEAAILKISITTAFNWRHKFHEALKKSNENIRLEGITEIDATYTPINLKGTKPENMPRISHHRKRRGHVGITNHDVCILTAIDEEDQILVKATKLEKESVDDYRKFLEGSHSIKTLVSDGIQGIEGLGKELQCESEIVKAKVYVSENGYSLGNINQLHSEIRSMMMKYRGVSIRHLQGYCDALCFFKRLRYQIDQKKIGPIGYVQSYPNYESILDKEICEKTIQFDLSQPYPYKRGFLRSAPLHQSLS